MTSDYPSTEIRIALPSKGELSQPTLDFLAASGLKVRRPNPRQYHAAMPTLPDVTVLFQRASDIFSKVTEGSADFGVTGLDVVAEKGDGQAHVIILHDDLGYGSCELVLAVPDNWIDVSTIEDLAELILLYKDRGDEFRIATKYPNLTRNHLYDRGIYHFTLVQADGALEAAPNMGYAEMIVDVTSTGTTLRENHLKRLAEGTLLKSQACLIANRRRLLENQACLNVARILLEMIEAHLRARRFMKVTMNVQADSPEAIQLRLSKDRQLAGMRGPSISRVYTKTMGEGSWYSVSVVIERHLLLSALTYFREIGGMDIVTHALDYVFEPSSSHFKRLLEKLKRDSN